MSTPADSNLVGRYASGQELIDAGVTQAQIDAISQPISQGDRTSNSDALFDYYSPYLLSWFTTGGGPDNIRAQRGNVTNYDLIAAKAAKPSNGFTYEILQENDERIDAPTFVRTPGINQGDIGATRDQQIKANRAKPVVGWLKRWTNLLP